MPSLSFNEIFKDLHSHFNTVEKGTHDDFVGERVVPQEGNMDYTAVLPPINVNELNSEIYQGGNNYFDGDSVVEEEDDDFEDIGAYEVHDDDDVSHFDTIENEHTYNIEMVETESDVDFDVRIDSDIVEVVPVFVDVQDNNDETNVVPEDEVTNKVNRDDDLEVMPGAIMHVQDNVTDDEVHIRGAKSSKNRVKRDGKVLHPMLHPCITEKCPRKCCTYVSQERRVEIYNEYWQDRTNQREFLLQRVQRVAKERKRSRNGSKKRLYTRKYTMKDESDGFVQVCQKFFLSTIGYKKDHVISWVFDTLEGKVVPDKRGSHDPMHKMSKETALAIVNHIESYHPAISHYRREHAPLRRYLPTNLSVQVLLNDFNEKAENHVSYSGYWRIFRKQNVSFTKLGEEECEACESYKQHACERKEDIAGEESKTDLSDREENEVDVRTRGDVNEKTTNVSDCDVCKRQEEHLERAKISRQTYKSDVKKNKDKN